VKFDEQERTALEHAGFAVADDDRAAYVEALVVIAAHDEKEYWLTFSLPNDTRIVCVLSRDQIAAAIMDDCSARSSQLQ
jgi:hypothetical protein